MTANEEYAALAAELEALWQSGQGESALADQLRERMEGPWHAMTSAERSQWLGKPAQTTPSPSPPPHPINTQ